MTCADGQMRYADPDMLLNNAANAKVRSPVGHTRHPIDSWLSCQPSCLPRAVQYVTTEEEPAFLRKVREFLFYPLLPREASKRVPIFDRGTGSKPARLKSGSLQADLSLIV